MGKCSNAFFSETTNMIKAKLYMNVHWMVLYNLKVFCSDMKFKMAATAGPILTLDPMGKMFQNASSLKPLGQLKPLLSDHDIAGPHRIINKRKLDIKKITTAYWSQKNVRSLPTT
jgi:hypothetical protein